MTSKSHNNNDLIKLPEKSFYRWIYITFNIIERYYTTLHIENTIINQYLKKKT